ncbi:succinate dehydrogenase or fumarate reductase, flavoprotein subunit [compost metagenome]
MLSDNNGKEINLGRQTAQAIVETGAAWDRWEPQEDPELEALLLKTPYVCTQYFEDANINPFKEKYRVDWICEGTMRATGGLGVNEDLQTNVPGLFAAGDVASREKVNGAGPPGGGPAAGWAMGAGFFSGQSAARFSLALGEAKHQRPLRAVGGAGLRPTGERAELDAKSIIGKVQEHMLAIDKNFWRDEASLSASLEAYNQLWKQARQGLAAADAEDARSSARATLRVREAAFLLAAARWINASALERRETRGLHRRIDYPELDIAQTHHLVSGGVDEVWVKVRPVDPTAVFPDKEKFFPLEKIA